MTPISWLSLVLGVISFFWIGLRRELPELRRQIEANNGRRAWPLFKFFPPYVLGAVAFGILLYMSMTPQPLDSHRHKLLTISTKDHTCYLDGRDSCEVNSAEEWFSIALKGQVVDPELSKLERRFGDLNKVRVFAIVEELGKPLTDSLLWIQQHDGGILDSLGRYECHARLGGKGPDSAADGHEFKVRIYIPDRDTQFRDRGTYRLHDLPSWLYLSEPYYITTRRPGADAKQP